MTYEVEIDPARPELLRRACERLGWTLHEGRKIFDYWGGQTAPCEHAISLPGHRMQIGLAVNPVTGKLTCQCDDILRYHLESMPQTFPQVYSAELVREELARQGFDFTERYHLDSRVLELEVCRQW